MIKNLIEAFNLIRDDPYLNSVLNNPQYYRARDNHLLMRVRSGFPAKVFPEFLDIALTSGAEKIRVSLPFDCYVCRVTEEVFSKLIDPRLFVECVNTLFEYKDLFQLAETSSDELKLRSYSSAYPVVVYAEPVSRQFIDTELSCDSAFSIRCIKLPTGKSDFYIIDYGATALNKGSGIVTTCDKHDFIDKLTAFLKPFEIESFIAKHEYDAKEALDKLLSVIESNLD